MASSLKLIVLFFFISISSLAQSNNFFKFIIECDSLYKNRKYKEAIQLFEMGSKYQTEEYNYRMFDYYFVACCYAQIEDRNNSFIYLNKLIEKYGYADTAIFKDKDLNNLKNDYRWNVFKNEIKKNIELVEKKKKQYSDIIAKLDSLHKIDQQETALLNIENLNKYDQNGKDSLNKRVYNAARQRSEEVLELLKNTPWLSKSIIGMDAFEMIFLSAQHSNDIRHMKMLLKKYRKNRQTPVDYAHYAMLYDRIQSKKKKGQRYGTQILINHSTGKKFYYTIENLERVNEYRKYCYYDSIQEDMKFHNMLVFEESTQEKQKDIK